MFLCHPRLLAVPEERWDPVLMRGLGPWPSWLLFLVALFLGQEEPPGWGSLPAVCCQGTEPTEHSRAEETAALQVHSCGETLTQFVFNQTPHADTGSPFNHLKSSTSK